LSEEGEMARKKSTRRTGRAAFAEAAMWVSEHLGEEVEEADSPGGLAWSMLNWAKENRDKFFTLMMPKAMGMLEEKGAEARKRELAESDRLEEMLRPLLGGVQRVFCEKCWREVEGEGLPRGVRMVFDPSAPPNRTKTDSALFMEQIMPRKGKRGAK